MHPSRMSSLSSPIDGSGSFSCGLLRPSANLTSLSKSSTLGASATGGVMTGGGGDSSTRCEFEMTRDDLTGMTSALAGSFLDLSSSGLTPSTFATGIRLFAVCLPGGRFASGFFGVTRTRHLLPIGQRGIDSSIIVHRPAKRLNPHAKLQSRKGRDRSVKLTIHSQPSPDFFLCGFAALRLCVRIAESQVHLRP